jgi:hypothetical protein
MPGKTDRIQDPELRASMEQAHASLRAGDYTDVVRRAAGAYLELIRRRPQLLEPQSYLRTVLFFPRLGARLQLDQERRPEVIFDREVFTFSEAVTYYEFAVDSLVREGL